MAIKITRRTGWLFNMGAKLNIKINGEVVGKLADNSSINIDISTPEVQLQVSQFGGLRSNKLPIFDGDIVTITASPFSSFSFLAIILLMLISRPLAETHWTRYVAIIALIGYGISHLVIPGYHYRLSKRQS